MMKIKKKIIWTFSQSNDVSIVQVENQAMLKSIKWHHINIR